MRTPQIPTVVLPAASADPASTVAAITETELLVSAAQHVSRSIYAAELADKTFTIYATVGAGAPGVLNVWVEAAPYDVAALYGRVGAVVAIAVTGVYPFSWGTQCQYCRLVAQAPGAGPAAIWAVTAVFEGAVDV